MASEGGSRPEAEAEDRPAAVGGKLEEDRPVGGRLEEDRAVGGRLGEGRPGDSQMEAVGARDSIEEAWLVEAAETKALRLGAGRWQLAGNFSISSLCSGSGSLTGAGYSRDVALRPR